MNASIKKVLLWLESVSLSWKDWVCVKLFVVSLYTQICDINVILNDVLQRQIPALDTR